jgi:uncharacterized protein
LVLPVFVAVGLTLALSLSDDAGAGKQVDCRTAWVQMRDGTLLATDIFAPKAPGRYPVLIQRNPYNFEKSDCPGGAGNTFAALAKGGYVAISQDVRGTGRSHGTFNPFFQEQNDGHDLVEWAASQPWSDGRVAMVSGSYLGASQWQAAVTNPPHLVAIAPAYTAFDYYDDWIYRRGVFDPLFSMQWAMAFAPDQLSRDLRRRGVPETAVDEEVASLRKKISERMLLDWLWRLPLAGDWNPQLKHVIPFYFTWLDHPHYDAYWAGIDVGERLREVKAPAFIEGAWYDLFIEGTLQTFSAMRTEAGSERARRDTFLVISCCGHSAEWDNAPGRIDWGPPPNDQRLERRFLDYHLRGTNESVSTEPRVQIMVLVPPDSGTHGGSFLLKADQFPPPGTRQDRWFLRSHGNANTCNGDGVLAESPPTESSEDRYTYDPRNPAPTMGGTNGSELIPPGAYDQSTVELRDDILVYTSAPLARELAIIGPVEVKLWARSSARDTDFTAKLVDVHPDGFAHNLVDHIVRASLRHGPRSRPALLDPDQIYEYTIELGHTATMLRVGHRLRLEISSSNFPRFARNLNTGYSDERTAHTVVAQQTILHDGSHPSYLMLPIYLGQRPQ